MENLATVVLAAGKSTRMKSKLSKVLHPLAGKPLVTYPVNEALKLGSQKLALVIGKGQKGQFDEAMPGGEKFEYCIQSEALGTGHAVMSAEKFLQGFNGYVLIIPGDVPLVQFESLKNFVTNVEAEDATCAIISTMHPQPGSYGRVLRDVEGKFAAIREAGDATDLEKCVNEINTGIFMVRTPWLFKQLKQIKPHNVQKEYYLTDIVELAVAAEEKVIAYCVEPHDQFLGVNDRFDLAYVNKMLSVCIAEHWMSKGVSIQDPDQTYIDCDVRIGQDTTVAPFTFLKGKTSIGKGCEIGVGAYLEDAVIGDNVHIKPYSVIEKSRIKDDGEIGPFSRVRPDSLIEKGVKLGNFVEGTLKKNAVMLRKKLQDYNVEGKITEIHPGPVITMYEFEPAAGVKINKIVSLADDLAVAMCGRSIRIVPHLPGKAAIGIEIPNRLRETVWLKDIIGDSKFAKSNSKLTIALGKNTQGSTVVSDLGKMPHLLIAGATGSGKSVAINSIICSILYKTTPEQVRMIMVDPKKLELSGYNGIPHLLLPVVTQPRQANLALQWALREMEHRYRLLSDVGVKNMSSYNSKIEKGTLKTISPEEGAKIQEENPDSIVHIGKLPYIVIIIDELADLMMISSKEIEENITRLAQMARAAGIHLIVATQRPSVDVITGLIKANFPTRMAFKVSSKHDSRTIIDTIGAEHLLGAGDMLFMPPGASGLVRIHGAFVSESEIDRVVLHLKEQGEPHYNEEILKPITNATGETDDEYDELYDTAIKIVAETRQASISMIQRKLRIGYNRAARMIEKMEAEGIVSPQDGSKPREVYVTNIE